MSAHRQGGSLRAYQTAEHELADLLADIDAEDVLVYMPHANDDALLEARMGMVWAQEESLGEWEN